MDGQYLDNRATLTLRQGSRPGGYTGHIRLVTERLLTRDEGELLSSHQPDVCSLMAELGRPSLAQVRIPPHITPLDSWKPTEALGYEAGFL